MDSPQFLTVPQLAERFPSFSVGALRWMLFNRETNGLDSAVVSLGRKVLIDEQAFVGWLRSQRGGSTRRAMQHPGAAPNAPESVRAGSP